MEIKTLKVDDLQQNLWNPNEMTDKVAQHLSTVVGDFGFLQPVLAWDDGTKIVIIDGEHRWKAMKENGHTMIEAKILSTDDMLKIGAKLKGKKMIDVEIDTNNVSQIAKVLTILMNQIKGENNPVKLAKLYEDLETSINIEQLSKLLDTSVLELESYKTLLNVVDSSGGTGAGSGGAELHEVSMVFNDSEYDIYSKAMERTGLSKDKEFVLFACGQVKAENADTIPSKPE